MIFLFLRRFSNNIYWLEGLKLNFEKKSREECHQILPHDDKKETVKAKEVNSLETPNLKGSVEITSSFLFVLKALCHKNLNIVEVPTLVNRSRVIVFGLKPK